MNNLYCYLVLKKFIKYGSVIIYVFVIYKGGINLIKIFFYFDLKYLIIKYENFLRVLFLNIY